MEFKEFQKHMERMLQEECTVLVDHKKIYQIIEKRGQDIQNDLVSPKGLNKEITICKEIQKARWKFISWLYHLNSGEGKVGTVHFRGMVIAEFEGAKKSGCFFDEAVIPINAIQQIIFED